MPRRLFLALAAMLGIGQRNAHGQGQLLRLPFPPVPENAAALAQKAVDAVRNVDGISLDYSPESLKQVDRVILRFHEEGKSSDEVGPTVFTLGCYVGEVFVRHLGASWTMPDETARRVGFSVMGIQIKKGQFLNPIGKAFKLLKNGSEDSVYYFYRVSEKSDG